MGIPPAFSRAARAFPSTKPARSSDVKLLAVDTALAHRFEPMERGHAERLAPMVEEVMTEAKLPFAALDRLAVTTGPGTFTGQRVGLAFARGLRVALNKPLIGITTLS